MTEWIIILVVGVIIAAVVGFLLGKKQHTQVAPTNEVDQHSEVSENSPNNIDLESKFKDKYAKMLEEAQTSSLQKAREIESKYKKLLAEAKDETQKLDEQLKTAISGNCDEVVKAQLQNVEKLKRKISDLEAEIKEKDEEIEENQVDIKEIKKKLNTKKDEYSVLQNNYDKVSKDAKQMREELGTLKQDLQEKEEELKLKMESLDFIQEILSSKRIESKDVAKLYKDLDLFEALIRGQVLDCYEMAWGDKGIKVGSSQYNEKKQQLMDAFNRWAAQKKKSWIDGKTTIAFVGEFSAGKTSIVNRILSQDDTSIPLLPVSTKATTAIPTYIAGGPVATYRFVTPDNIEKNLSESTFKKVSKEVLDQVKGVSSLIKYFVMTYKNPNLNGMSVLDTPGFNSNDSEDKDRTIEVINECDALFWVFDVNAGTVNRSSISLIKEKLNKPLYVLINKTDTKPASEVDKVEALIKKSLADAGLKVERFIRFSSKAPLADIMDPIKAVKTTAETNTFVEDVFDDLENVEKLYDDFVKKAQRNYDEQIDKYSELIEEFNATLNSICKECAEAADIPHWETHFFSKDRFEMNAEEGTRLMELLTDISENQKSLLVDTFNRLQESQTVLDNTYADLEQSKQSYAQVKKCIDLYNKETKKWK